MSERDLLDAVRVLARSYGWLAYHTNRSDRSEPGFPDVFLVRTAGHKHDGGPHVCEIVAELKSRAGRVTPEQEAWLTALRATCHPYRRVLVLREGEALDDIARMMAP